MATQRFGVFGIPRSTARILPPTTRRLPWHRASAGKNAPAGDAYDRVDDGLSFAGREV